MSVPVPDDLYSIKYWQIPHPPSEYNTKMHNYLMQFFKYEVFCTTMTALRKSLEKGPGLN